MFSHCKDIQEKMNKAGGVRTPFLFGFDFEMNEGFFIENPLNQHDILFDINGITNTKKLESEILPFTFNAFPETKETYEKKFQIVKEGLLHGNSFLCNLTIKTPVETSLSLKDIFHRSRALYKMYIPGRFVCFSPECFVRIENGKIFSYPMKGTIDGSIENAENIILNDYKEKAEHYTIVDLIRNDVNRIASHVRVNRFRYIDTLETNKGSILQVSSEIEGTLKADYKTKLGSTICDMLPAGSVSGAPKKATLDIICAAGNEPRGYYTGVAGYFNGETLDSCVLIRYIEETENGLFFRSGGGITINSLCEQEYEEGIKKVYLPFGNDNQKYVDNGQ